MDLKIKKLKINQLFKALFLIGIGLVFISFFLTWYRYQVFDIHHNMIASWEYDLFTGWNSLLSDAFTFNILFKPDNLNFSPIIHIMLIGLCVVCVYTALMKDVESSTSPQQLKNYAYLNFFLLLLVGFYVVIFPVAYLLANDLYFPYLKYEDIQANITYVYSLSEGYYLQLFAFILIIPYSLFYYQTISTFEREEHTAEKIMEKYIQDSQEPLDLDKFIAEEELKKKMEMPDEIDLVYSQLHKKRSQK